MFAVIRTGGKQYRVAKDDTIVVERLAGDPGSMVELSDVLMIGGDGKAPQIGHPAVDKAAVFAEVVQQARGDKILVFKKQRRKNHRRTLGHRQDLTVLRILDVSPTGTKPKAAAKKAGKPAAKADDTAPEAEKAKKAKPVPTEAKKEADAKPKKKAPAKKTETKSKDTKAAPKKKAESKAAPKKKAAAKGDTKKKAPAKKKATAKGKKKD